MKSVCRVLLPALLLLAVCCSTWLPAAFEPDRPVQANDAIPAGPPESELLTLPDLPSWLDIAGASVFTPPSGRNNGRVHASAFPRTANHEPGTALRLPKNCIRGQNLPGPASHPAEPGLSRTSRWAYPAGPGKYTSGSIVAGIGGVTGLLGGAVGKLVSPMAGALLKAAGISSPVAAGALGGALVGGASGYAGGFTDEYLRTGDLGQAHQAGMRGLANGLAIGGLMGGVAGYKQARRDGLNPWKNAPAEDSLLPPGRGSTGDDSLTVSDETPPVKPHVPGKEFGLADDTPATNSATKIGPIEPEFTPRPGRPTGRDWVDYCRQKYGRENVEWFSLEKLRKQWQTNKQQNIRAWEESHQTKWPTTSDGRPYIPHHDSAISEGGTIWDITPKHPDIHPKMHGGGKTIKPEKPFDPFPIFGGN